MCAILSLIIIIIIIIIVVIVIVIVIIIIIIIIHIQAKTNDRKVRHFGDILAPLSRETKLEMRLRE